METEKDEKDLIIEAKEHEIESLEASIGHLQGMVKTEQERNAQLGTELNVVPEPTQEPSEPVVVADGVIVPVEEKKALKRLTMASFKKTNLGKTLVAAGYIAVSAAITYVATAVAGNPELFGPVTPFVNIVLVYLSKTFFDKKTVNV